MTTDTDSFRTGHRSPVARWAHRAAAAIAMAALVPTVALSPFAGQATYAASTPALPQSCADVHAAFPSAADGTYAIYLQNTRVNIYCANMSTAPAEYITLVNHDNGSGTGSNSGFYYGCHAGHRTGYGWWSGWYCGPNTITDWVRIRINPATLVVNQSDTTFATLVSQGTNVADGSQPGYVWHNPTFVSYGTASGCTSQWPYPHGKGNIDLTGTGFALANNQTFSNGGFENVGGYSISANRQVVTMTGDGWCGGTGPVGSLTLKVVDTTAPTTTSAMSGKSGTNGWYRGPVTLDLTANDPDNPASALTTSYSTNGGATWQTYQPANPPTLNADGHYTVLYRSQDPAGNLETAKSIAFQIDQTPPTMTLTSRTPANASGWNNGPVTAVWSCQDALSGVVTSTVTKQVTTQGANQAATGTCQDKAGNTTNATVSQINIDQTAPVVSFSGNAKTYTVDQTVQITCQASDTLSGVASSTCANLNAPASSLTLGTHTLTASATDRAGNRGTGSTSFTIVDTSGGLCGLTRQYVTNQTVASSLCTLLSQGKVAGYIALVHAYGLSPYNLLTPTQAATLIRLAQTLG